MTQTTAVVPTPTNLPFQLCNFAPEVQQDFKPTRPLGFHWSNSPTKPLLPSTKHSFPLAELSERKTLRTTLIEENGSIVGAKIDLTTGEVTPHEYKHIKRVTAKAKREPSDIDPPWVRIPARNQTSYNKDISRKKLFNGLKMYLSFGKYLTLSDALEDLPILDHIITGATELDLGGNTRNLNIGILFAMLQNLDFVTSKTVMDFMDCSLRHAQKVAQCLRVIVTAFESETKK